MHIAITGGTGFVGQQLTNELIKQGNHVYILTRHPNQYQNTDQVTYVEWINEGSEPWEQLTKVNAFINLAGESLFGYWTPAKKQRILASRLTATNHTLEIIKKLDHKPEVLINASAIGFYGTSIHATFTEYDSLPGTDFLAQVTSQWENVAKQAEQDGVRTVLARFGLILGNKGSLPLITLPFKWMIGGKVGSGKQWMSWVHIKDVVNLLIFAINNDKISGALNVVSPQPVQNQQFSKTLAKAVHRPYWLPAPSFALKALLGEMSLLVLEGQRVLPEKAISYQYQFQFDSLKKALEDIKTR